MDLKLAKYPILFMLDQHISSTKVIRRQFMATTLCKHQIHCSRLLRVCPARSNVKPNESKFTQFVSFIALNHCVGVQS